MRINLHGDKLLIYQIEDYATKKFNKLYRHLPDLHEINVNVKQEDNHRGREKSCINVTAQANEITFHAEQRGPTLHHSVDGVLNKLLHQITHYKGKRLDRWQGHLPSQKRADFYNETSLFVEEEEAVR